MARTTPCTGGMRSCCPGLMCSLRPDRSTTGRSRPHTESGSDVPWCIAGADGIGDHVHAGLRQRQGGGREGRRTGVSHLYLTGRGPSRSSGVGRGTGLRPQRMARPASTAKAPTATAAMASTTACDARRGGAGRRASKVAGRARSARTASRVAMATALPCRKRSAQAGRPRISGASAGRDAQRLDCLNCARRWVVRFFDVLGVRRVATANARSSLQVFAPVPGRYARRTGVRRRCSGAASCEMDLSAPRLLAPPAGTPPSRRGC